MGSVEGHNHIGLEEKYRRYFQIMYIMKERIIDKSISLPFVDTIGGLTLSFIEFKKSA